MKPKYDIFWKGMIEEVIEDLLLFVEPEIGKELDLGRGFQFMDKELAEMYPEPTKPANTKVVDKLGISAGWGRAAYINTFGSTREKREGFRSADV
jgi:hypothetical protein